MNLILQHFIDFVCSVRPMRRSRTEDNKRVRCDPKLIILSAPTRWEWGWILRIMENHSHYRQIKTIFHHHFVASYFFYVSLLSFLYQFFSFAGALQWENKNKIRERRWRENWALTKQLNNTIMIYKHKQQLKIWYTMLIFFPFAQK